VGCEYKLGLKTVAELGRPIDLCFFSGLLQIGSVTRHGRNRNASSFILSHVHSCSSSRSFLHAGFTVPLHLFLALLFLLHPWRTIHVGSFRSGGGRGAWRLCVRGQMIALRRIRYGAQSRVLLSATLSQPRKSRSFAYSGARFTEDTSLFLERERPWERSCAHS